MSQYWLKSLGTSGPGGDAWVPDRGLEGFELATGPVIREKPPRMTVGDRVLLHSPAHSRIVAEGEIVGAPSWRPDRPGGNYSRRNDPIKYGAPGLRLQEHKDLAGGTRPMATPMAYRVVT